jgi:hypothetical protein
MVMRVAPVALMLVGLCGSQGFAETCNPRTLDVQNKTYQRLSTTPQPWNAALTNAYVWVDNIDSKLFGGYDPFDVYVLVGRIYPPFSTNIGKLSSGGFLRLSDPKKDVNNDLTGPLRVPAALKGELKLAPTFSVGKSRFSLRAVRVTLQRVGDNERIELRVCQE